MEKEKGDTTSIQIVCFKIGKEEYGIDILKVQELLKLPKITELPKTANYIMGVIDLRGKVIPIIELGKKFGLEGCSSDDAKRAIVVEISNKKIGLAIDSVSHVIKIDSKDIEPPPPIVKGVSGRYIVGITKSKEEFVVILDIDQVFSVEEIAEL